MIGFRINIIKVYNVKYSSPYRCLIYVQLRSFHYSSIKWKISQGSVYQTLIFSMMFCISTTVVCKLSKPCRVIIQYPLTLYSERERKLYWRQSSSCIQPFQPRTSCTKVSLFWYNCTNFRCRNVKSSQCLDEPEN